MMKEKILIVLLVFFSLAGLGQEAQKIKITDLEKIVSESRGPLIVNFWATFCKPCMEEIPNFQKMQAKYEKDGLQILFVSLTFRMITPKK
jgi:thiol-disulfide isomerase/thioredoxin